MFILIREVLHNLYLGIFVNSQETTVMIFDTNDINIELNMTDKFTNIKKKYRIFLVHFHRNILRKQNAWYDYKY